MADTDQIEPRLSIAELRLLGYLNQLWPAAITLRPETAPRADNDKDDAAFVEMVQSLNDNGLVLYEAFLMEASSGMRFVETMITPRGKAALRLAEVEA